MNAPPLLNPVLRDTQFALTSLPQLISVSISQINNVTLTFSALGQETVQSTLLVILTHVLAKQTFWTAELFLTLMELNMIIQGCSAMILSITITVPQILSLGVVLRHFATM